MKIRNNTKKTEKLRQLLKPLTGPQIRLVELDWVALTDGKTLAAHHKGKLYTSTRGTDCWVCIGNATDGQIQHLNTLRLQRAETGEALIEF